LKARQPHLIIIAGPNGAGKSTTALSLLKGTLRVTEFVNADLIAQGLSGFQPESAVFHAGRVMLERIHYLAKKRVDFAFETTLASRTFASWIAICVRQDTPFVWSFYGCRMRNLQLPVLRKGYTWEVIMYPRKLSVGATSQG
jgi:predicted ABC-type ATPase